VASPHLSSAESNMLFILDGSGSMWGQVDGVAKIQTAKETLGILLKDLPPDSKLGLMVYGHRSEGDCKDVEVVSGIGETDAATLTTKINGISPQGKTPISFALESALPVFESFKGKNNHIILISDGIETCGGDPCASSKNLADAGINLKVHVVGFDVSGDAKKQLQCIAANGGGKYFDASSADAFKEAVAEVKQVAEATPEPVKEPEQYFFDDFNGDELKEHWEVINPDPDAFIVENGELFVINSSFGSLKEDNIPNIFRLTKPMPDGNWTINTRATMEIQTHYQSFFIGIYNEKENYIIANYFTDIYPAHYIIYQNIEKMSAGKPTQFRGTVTNQDLYSAEASKKFLTYYSRPMLLRMKKEGRSFTVSFKYEGKDTEGKDFQWLELEKLSSLRAKGNLVLGLYQWNEDFSGETILKVDWVKIETY